MLYTLDTNAIAAILRQDKPFLEHLRACLREGHELTLNAVCYYETKRGLEPGIHTRKLQLFEALCQRQKRLDLTTSALDSASESYQYLRTNGIILEDADILLAGIAIANNATLVTRNTKHFNRIPNLKLENWEA